MARVTHVKAAQPRYKMVPVLDEDGNQITTPVLRKNGSQKMTRHGQPVFRRQTVADKSQPLPPERCGKCGKDILPGSPYKWVEVKRTYGGVRYVRCAACPTWRQSELTSSKMAGVYAMQEEFDVSGCQNADELTEAATEAAQAVRDVAEEYREAATNIEEGFGHPVAASEELNEKADELEAWADEIEGWQPDDAPECPVCHGEGTVEEGDTCEHCEEERGEWVSDQADALGDLVQSCPV